MRRAIDFWDFIEPDLYSNPKYKVKQQTYFFWSDKKQEYQEHKVTEALQYRDIEEYVKKGLIWLNT
jgi:hypothetical protein